MKSDPNKSRLALILILAFCFIIRLVAILFLNVVPESDFLTYHQMAETIANGIPLMSKYGAVFPHTIGYAMVLSVVYKIFGVSVFYIQIFNIIIATLTAYLIYKLTTRLTTSKIGLLSAFLYAIFPSFILYSELIATEMLFTLLFLIVIYLICLLNGKLSYSLVFLMGIVAAITNSIRPCGPVVLFAISLYIIFILKEAIFKKIASILILIVIYTACYLGIYSVISNLNGFPVAKSPVGYNIYVGGNIENYGAWNIDDASFSGSIMEKENFSPDEFHKEFLKLGIQRFIYNGFINNVKLIAIKFGLMWGTDSLVCFYLEQDLNFYNILSIYHLKSMCNGYHILILIFIILGAKELFFNENTDYKKSGLLFISLIVMGIAAQHLIAEVMERYSYSAMAVMLPIASYGFYSQMDKLKGGIRMFKSIREDINAVLERDPAAKSAIEVFLLSPGIHALFWHRVAYKLFKMRLVFLSKLISQVVRFFTGIEIHPGAKIGKGVMIDHGMGVVIGETAEVGDGCTIYQNVTLGGTGKDKGKRHPTIGDNVLIGSGAKVLGPFKVGNNSKIAANAVVLSEVPENSTCVGVPARVVIKDNIKVASAKDWQMDQTHMPDPVSQELCKLKIKIEQLEKKLAEK
jgi:serine O-acetyltransferase